MMSDVLKNNHLEGAANLLVRKVDDIDEIWERLIRRCFSKRSYQRSARLVNFRN